MRGLKEARDGGRNETWMMKRKGEMGDNESDRTGAMRRKRNACFVLTWKEALSSLSRGCVTNMLPLMGSML